MFNLSRQHRDDVSVSPVEHRKVEWAEVGVKVLVHELVVDAKVMRVGRGLWLDGGLEGDKVESGKIQRQWNR